MTLTVCNCPPTNMSYPGAIGQVHNSGCPLAVKPCSTCGGTGVREPKETQ